MNQAIFNLGLSMEGTSLFILMDHLSDGGASLVMETVEAMWNGSPDELDDAVRELRKRGVLGLDASGRWFLEPQSNWD